MPCLPLDELTDDHREWWEERAALMEYGGGMSRERAERTAWSLLCTRFNLPFESQLSLGLGAAGDTAQRRKVRPEPGQRGPTVLGELRGRDR